MYERDQALHNLGIVVLESEPGHAVTQLEVGDQHLNGLDVGHGGVLFTLADAAMAYASNSGLPDDQLALALGGEIDFLRPVRLGATITARAVTVATTGRTSVHDVRLTDEDEHVVCLFRGRTRQVARR